MVGEEMTKKQAKEILDGLIYICGDRPHHNCFPDETLDDMYLIADQLLAVARGWAD